MRKRAVLRTNPFAGKVTATRNARPGFQLGAMPPHLRHADAKVETELAPRTSGGRERLSSNRMLASWQGIATAIAAVLPGYGSRRLQWL
jgi:hypothetical protein